VINIPCPDRGLTHSSNIPVHQKLNKFNYKLFKWYKVKVFKVSVINSVAVFFFSFMEMF